MMINGPIYITNNIDQAASMFGNSKLAILSEMIDVPIDPNDPNVIMASCLLPPPAAKIAEIDGDAEMFYQIYSEYLLSDVPVDFISVILGFLHMGGTLILLIQCDMNAPWVIQLMNHFRMYYGMTIGTQMNAFGYDQSYDDCINDILISADIISPYEYLANRTIGRPISGYVLYEKLNPGLGTDLSVFDIDQMSMVLNLNPTATLAVSFKGDPRK